MLGLPDRVRACLFDLDGVVTRTAEVHRAVWQEVFDGLLAERGMAPFTESDYLAYVDGKPRRDGVRDFLASRSIYLSEGDPDDLPVSSTVAGVANRKNERLLARLRQDGVEVYDGSVRYIEAARAAGLRTAVVTASANCSAVLKAAAITDLFDVRIDGIVADRQHLAGKPAPDTFLAAIAALRLAPAQGAVFEDALAGVAAGRAGNFGHVVGVDRVGQAAALLEHGADTVVADLSQLMN